MEPSRRFADIESSIIREMVSRADQISAAGHEVARCEIGRPDFDSPQVAKDALTRALDAGRVHYASNAGVQELREAIAHDQRQRNHLEITADDIVVTNGAIEALFITMLAVADPGDEIVLTEPCWPYYTQMLRLVGAVPKVVPMARDDQGFHLDVAAIADAVTARTRGIVVNSPSNPTGGVASRDELQAVVDLAHDRDVCVISDEVYEQLVFDGATHVSPGSLPRADHRTVTIGSVSKTYSMTGWRIGYAALPAPLRRAALLAHTYTNASVSTFSQHGAAAAFTHGQADVERMRRVYESRRTLTHEMIGRMEGFRVVPSSGTFYVFVEVLGGGSDVDVARGLLEEAHIATVPGSAFGPSGAGHLRLSIACDDEALARGLERMGTWGTQHLTASSPV